MKNYREIPEDRILKFKATPGFKGWKHFFDGSSVVHPAKMNLNLLKWILSNYTKESDTVLDPMAGTGSTAILASIMGRNGIALEYEPKFCKMIKENIQKTICHKTLTPRGKIFCINGDARELSKYLDESDIIISSPPYGNRLSDVAIQDGDPARMGYRQTIDMVLTSPPYSGKEQKSKRSRGWGPWNLPKQKNGFKQDKPKSEPYEYSENESQIGNLKYGKIDAVITSPPYGSDNANLQGRDDNSAKSVLETTGMRSIPLKENNLGNLDEKTYLSEMANVYSECYKVLRQSGIMILVIKNFIREKQVIRLDEDTIRLCKSVGFNLIDRLYFKIPTKSFWLHLYHQKYPDVPEVKYEDILVFEKTLDIKGVISKNE